jgi:hypothetical protein
MFLLGTILIGMGGCRSAEKSQIVTLFQSAGGGDASQSTAQGITQFLGQHEDVRKQITPLCQQKRTNASAVWSSTEEGKICAANDSANFFGKTTVKSDGVKF